MAAIRGRPARLDAAADVRRWPVAGIAAGRRHGAMRTTGVPTLSLWMKAAMSRR